MKLIGKTLASGIAVYLIVLLFIQSNTKTATADLPLQDSDSIQGPFVSPLVEPGLSPPVRTLPVAADEPGEAYEIPSRRNPLADEPDQGRRGTWNRENVPLDPLIALGLENQGGTPGLLFDFQATSNPTGCGTCSPPDTNGDVGPNHYVHLVNATKVAIYNKSGTLVGGPFNLGTLWTSGNCTSNAGDPVVLYDPIADRWVLSQFADPNHMCFAI